MGERRPLVYADTSALGALLVEQAETRALIDWLDRTPARLVSSDLLEIELRRMAVREGRDQSKVSSILDGVSLAALDRATYRSAGLLPMPNLRTLDALHLEAPMRLDVEAVLTYDHRLADAARGAGLDVIAPGSISLRGAASRDQSGRGGLRLCLTSARSRFASSRRRCEPRVGRVGRRVGVGATAARSSMASRSLAAVRLRRWERCSAALIVSTVPDSRVASRSRAKVRWASVSAVVVPMSRLSCTRESAVLTPWPPGPDACENCSRSSPAGTVNP